MINYRLISLWITLFLFIVLNGYSVKQKIRPFNFATFDFDKYRGKTVQKLLDAIPEKYDRHSFFKPLFYNDLQCFFYFKGKGIIKISLKSFKHIKYSDRKGRKWDIEKFKKEVIRDYDIEYYAYEYSKKEIKELYEAQKWFASSLRMNFTIKELKELNNLHLLRNKDLKGKDLKHLRLLYNLKSLTLGKNSSITNEDLTHIGNLPLLRGLSLLSINISDKGLKHIQNLRRLRFLQLDSNPINGDGFVYLKKLKYLDAISLRNTQVNDKGLAKLLIFKNLTSISLEYTHITDKGLEIITHLKNLEHLDLEGTSITDKGLKSLASLIFLYGVGCANTKVTKKGYQVYKLMQKKAINNWYESNRKKRNKSK